MCKRLDHHGLVQEGYQSTWDASFSGNIASSQILDLETSFAARKRRIVLMAGWTA